MQCQNHDISGVIIDNLDRTNIGDFPDSGELSPSPNNLRRVDETAGPAGVDETTTQKSHMKIILVTLFKV